MSTGLAKIFERKLDPVGYRAEYVREEKVDVAAVVREIVERGEAWAKDRAKAEGRKRPSSQRDLVQAVGEYLGKSRTQGSVNQWKTKANTPGDILLTIALLADVSIDELLRGKSEESSRLDDLEERQRRTADTLEEIADQIRRIREQQDRQRLTLLTDPPPTEDPGLPSPAE